MQSVIKTKKSCALPQACPWFSSTIAQGYLSTCTSSQGLPTTSFQGKGWERRNTDRVLEPALFLQKPCGKSKILIAINKKSDPFKGGSCQPDPGSWVSAKGCVPAANTMLLNHRAQQIPFPDHQTLPKNSFLPTQVCSIPRCASSYPVGAQETFPSGGNHLSSHAGLNIPLVFAQTHCTNVGIPWLI